MNHISPARRFFKLPSPASWTNPSGDKWQLTGCVPVYREPGGTWVAKSGHRTETIWLIPEVFGESSTVPGDVAMGRWVACDWDSQAGRWVLAGSAGTGGGFALCKVRTAFTTHDLRTDAKVLHVYGSIPGVERDDLVTLYNTIQVFDGAVDDFVLAIPHDDGRATNIYGVATLEIFVKACSPTSLNDPGLPDGTSLAITDPSFAAMAVGSAITPFTVVSTGGVPPRVYSVQSGALPAGLTLSASSGQVSGSPTASGTGSVVFRVTDDETNTADTSSISWTVNAQLAIADPTFPAMTQGVAITPFSLAASGGISPYSYSVQSGALPAGLSLNTSSGQVSGTPSAAGSGSVVFRASDSVPATADTSSISWTVGPPGV